MMATETCAREPRPDRLPSPAERTAAEQLCQQLQTRMGGDVTLGFVGEEEDKVTAITLPPGLSEQLMELLRHVADGNAVMLLPVHQILTTQQAADILNVSRPFLITLLERAEIDYTLVGRHRRIRAEDVFAYRRQHDQKRAKALSKLANQDAQNI